MPDARAYVDRSLEGGAWRDWLVDLVVRSSSSSSSSSSSGDEC